MPDAAQEFDSWWAAREKRLADHFVEAGIQVHRAEREHGLVYHYSEVELYRCTACAALIEEDHREEHIAWHERKQG